MWPCMFLGVDRVLLGLTVSNRGFVAADTIFIVEKPALRKKKRKLKLYCIVTSVRTIL